MKSFALIALIACIVASVSANYTHGHNGRPACGSVEEMGKKYWRNNFDPTRLWVCTSEGVPATEVLCPTAMGYSDESQCCLNWAKWKWTPPYDPPTMA